MTKRKTIQKRKLTAFKIEHLQKEHKYSPTKIYEFYKATV